MPISQTSNPESKAKALGKKEGQKPGAHRVTAAVCLDKANLVIDGMTRGRSLRFGRDDQTKSLVGGPEGPLFHPAISPAHCERRKTAERLLSAVCEMRNAKSEERKAVATPSQLTALT